MNAKLIVCFVRVWEVILFFVLRNFAMKQCLSVALKRVSDSSSIGLDFVPPMSEAAMKIPPRDEADSVEVGPPKKKRQVTLESTVTPGVAVVEPNVASSETGSSPVTRPQSKSESTENVAPGESNDRTSRDYYFDSYSHHAIREYDYFYCLSMTI